MPKFVDRILKCQECGAEFVFTAELQQFFYDKNFKNEPKRCKACKLARVERALGNKSGQRSRERRSARSSWLRETSEALNSLLELPPNWDSYGAAAIDPRCTAYALELLGSTMRDHSPAPAVVPTSRGGVQLEWHMRGLDLEIEVCSPGVSHVLYENRQTGTKWEGEVAADVSELRELVSKLSAPIGTNDKRIGSGLHAEPRAS